MAFNKVDAYTYEDNGTVNVYDGMNIQLYASGNVYTSFPYIEYKQQGSSVPVLSTAVLNDNNSNNIFSLSNMENDGFVDGDGNFHYVLFSEESPLTYNSFVTDAVYNWEVQAVDAFGGGSAGPLVAMSGSNWTYVLEGGPDKFWIKDLGNNQYAIDYARNPNWTPPVSNVPNLIGFELGHTIDGDMIDMSSIEVSGFTPPDGKYHWQLQNVNFGSAITENDSYLFVVTTDDGPNNETNVGASANAELVNDGVGLGWAFHPSNSPLYEVFITVTAQSDTTGDIEIVEDPNWTPSNQRQIE